MKHNAVAALVLAMLFASLRAQYDSVTVIQCGPDTVVSQFGPSSSPRPEFWNPVDNCVYLTTDWDGVFVLDCDNDSVVGQFDFFFERPYALDTLDNKLYAAREGWPQWEFTSVDLGLRTVRVLFTSPQFFTDVGWSPRLNRLYCSGWNDTAGIWVFDCASDSELGRIHLHPVRFGLNLSNDKMCCAGLSTIYLYDLAGDSLLDTIWAPSLGMVEPWWNPVDGNFYLWDYDKVWVIDGRGDTLIDTVRVSRGGPICHDMRDNTLYVRTQFGDTVLAFDCATLSVRARIPGVDVDLAVYDSVDNRIYAISDFSYDHKLTVIDCASNTIIRQIRLPTISSWGLCWNALMNRIYTGGNSWMHAVAGERGRPATGGRQRMSSVMRGLPPGAIAFDATGRRVLNPKPGIYFVRERSAVGGGRSAVHKVVLTR